MMYETLPIVNVLGNPYRPSKTIDLATDQTPSPDNDIQIQTPPEDDVTVQKIITILLLYYGAKKVLPPYNTRMAGALAALVRLLGPSGVTQDALRVALTVTMGRNGTVLRPNAVLSGTDLPKATDTVKSQQDLEIAYRAAFLLNSARRTQKRLDDAGARNLDPNDFINNPSTVRPPSAVPNEPASSANAPSPVVGSQSIPGKLRESESQQGRVHIPAGRLSEENPRKPANPTQILKIALADENLLYQRHEQARKGRLRAAAQTASASKKYGQLLGWYLDPSLNNDAECIAANGNNYYARTGTVIGWPGSVHPNCGCTPGPPHANGGMVNDVINQMAKSNKRIAKVYHLKRKAS